MEFAIQVGGGQAPHDKTGLEAIVEETLLAEELGFDVTFVPDHYVFESLGNLLTEIPAYELFLVMATLAQRTKRIRIGSHVACLLFRHPVMHARLFAQLDEASGGRVIAGVGAGGSTDSRSWPSTSPTPSSCATSASVLPHVR